MSNPNSSDFKKISSDFTDIGGSESVKLRKDSLASFGFDSMRGIPTRSNLEGVLEVQSELTESDSKERFGDSLVKSRSEDTPDWEHSVEKEHETKNTLEKIT